MTLRSSADDRRQREATNQALFRDINNKLRDLHPLRSEDVVGFLCECGAGGCMTTISIPLAKYAEIRSHPRRFITLPGHHHPEVERVVEDHGGWTVVEAFSDVADALT
jgi:hypothetical protein